MTTQILENYLDSKLELSNDLKYFILSMVHLGIRHLPSDLQRNFGLMSEIDKKVESMFTYLTNKQTNKQTNRQLSKYATI